MSAATEDKATGQEGTWRLALAAWFILHTAVTLFVPRPLRYFVEPGWWLAIYFGYRLGRAARAGGGE